MTLKTLVVSLARKNKIFCMQTSDCYCQAEMFYIENLYFEFYTENCSKLIQKLLVDKKNPSYGTSLTTQKKAFIWPITPQSQKSWTTQQIQHSLTRRLFPARGKWGLSNNRTLRKPCIKRKTTPSQKTYKGFPDIWLTRLYCDLLPRTTVKDKTKKSIHRHHCHLLLNSSKGCTNG